MRAPIRIPSFGYAEDFQIFFQHLLDCVEYGRPVAVEQQLPGAFHHFEFRPGTSSTKVLLWKMSTILSSPPCRIWNL